MMDERLEQAVNRRRDHIAQRHHVLAQLEQLGFYTYTPPERLPTVQADTLRTGVLFAHVPDRVLGQPDWEAIQEGHAAPFVRSTLPVLAQYGITIQRIEEDYFQSHPHVHRVILDGVPYVLFWYGDEHEPPLPYTRALGLPGLFTALFAARGLATQAYLAYAFHDDPRLVLLTPPMYDLLEQTTCFLDWWEGWWQT